MGQGCLRREGAPEAVEQAVGGGCQSGWGRLPSVTNAVEAGTWCQGDSGWGTGWAPWRGGGGTHGQCTCGRGIGRDGSRVWGLGCADGTRRCAAALPAGVAAESDGRRAQALPPPPPPSCLTPLPPCAQPHALPCAADRARGVPPGQLRQQSSDGPGQRPLPGAGPEQTDAAELQAADPGDRVHGCVCVCVQRAGS